MILKPRPFRKPNLGHPLAKGLVGYWLMNEGTGNTVQDLSGNGHTGTFVNETVWDAGKFGSCLSFDGTDDYVNINSIKDTVQNDTEGTMSAWFYADTIGSEEDQTALSFTLGTWGVIALGRFEDRLIGIGTEEGETRFSIFAPGVLTAGEWYHAVLVHNGATPILYLNGNEVDVTLTGVDYTYWFSGGTVNGASIGSRKPNL